MLFLRSGPRAKVNVDLKWHVIRAARIATVVRKERSLPGGG